MGFYLEQLLLRVPGCWSKKLEVHMSHSISQEKLQTLGRHFIMSYGSKVRGSPFRYYEQAIAERRMSITQARIQGSHNRHPLILINSDMDNPWSTLSIGPEQAFVLLKENGQIPDETVDLLISDHPLKLVASLGEKYLGVKDAASNLVTSVNEGVDRWLNKHLYNYTGIRIDSRDEDKEALPSLRRLFAVVGITMSGLLEDVSSKLPRICAIQRDRSLQPWHTLRPHREGPREAYESSMFYGIFDALDLLVKLQIDEIQHKGMRTAAYKFLAWRSLIWLGKDWDANLKLYADLITSCEA